MRKHMRALSHSLTQVTGQHQDGGACFTTAALCCCPLLTRTRHSSSRARAQCTSSSALTPDRRRRWRVVVASAVALAARGERAVARLGRRPHSVCTPASDHARRRPRPPARPARHDARRCRGRAAAPAVSREYDRPRPSRPGHGGYSLVVKGGDPHAIRHLQISPRRGMAVTA